MKPLSLPLLLLLLPFTHSTPDYLKLPLLHRNPLPSLSSDSLRLSFLHNHHHHHHRNTTPALPLSSGASTGSGQYFLHLLLGSPPQPTLLVADTGSDLVWTTCSPSRHRSSIHAPPPSSPTFFPRLSSSFHPYHCFDSPCQLVPHPTHSHCPRTPIHSPCHFNYSYADGSTTSGFFSRETSSFNTTSGIQITHQPLSFGCAFNVSASPSFNGAHGVMGLGRGPISLPSQLAPRFGNRFSYCLMDYTLSPTPTSYLVIGAGAGEGESTTMRYTPLLSNPLSPTFYYIAIESVYVGGVKLRISPSVWAVDEDGNGGAVVDSGTTLTFLADEGYGKILTAFKRRVKLPRSDELTPGFDLCVNVSGVSRPSLPRMSFRLGGGSLFAPPPRNYFIDTADGVKCLALRPVGSALGFSVIGNVMQQGFLFEFDKDRSRLGFSRRGCAIT